MAAIKWTCIQKDKHGNICQFVNTHTGLICALCNKLKDHACNDNNNNKLIQMQPLPDVAQTYQKQNKILSKQSKKPTPRPSNDNNNDMDIKQAIKYDPPFSNRFYRNLPSDPWSEQHFYIINLTGNDTSTQIPIPSTHTMRKRRFDEMDQTLQQNTSHCLKRRKLNGNNAFNGNDHKIQENGNNQLKYPNPETFLCKNSLIAVQESIDGLQDGAILSVVNEVKSGRISCIDYKTGKCLRNDSNLKSCYFIVPYIDKRTYLISESLDNSVLALEIKDYDSDSIVFGTKYKLAQVISVPNSMDNYNDRMNDANYFSDQCLIEIRYQDKNYKIGIPLYTLIESAVNVNWQNIKIPTVIKIIPVLATIIGNKFKCESKEHIEVIEEKINDDPPFSNRFCRNLPSDPWLEQHFIILN